MNSPYLPLDFEDIATFKTVRGDKLKVIDQNGFEYTRGRTYNDVAFWRCDKFKKLRCKGKAKTWLVGNNHMMKIYGIHNHLPTKAYL